jgi:hypothetical protein
MAFVVEDLTDDIRQAMGFVKNQYDHVKWSSFGASYVSFWAIDHERNATCYGRNSRNQGRKVL